MKKQSKKLVRNISIILGIIIILGVLITVFSFRTSQATFSYVRGDASCNDNPYTKSIELISQNAETYTYKFTVIPNCIVSGDASAWLSSGMSLSETIKFDISNLPADIQKGKTTQSTTFEIFDAKGYRSGGVQTPYYFNVDISNRASSCTVTEPITTRVWLTDVPGGRYIYYSTNGYCSFSVSAFPTDTAVNNYNNLVGISKMISTVTFYKEGFEPSISVHRFSNNQCASLTIKPSEKTSNDYLTLNQCQSKIISQPDEPQPKGFVQWIQALGQWIRDFIGRIFGVSQIISGLQEVKPNTQATYQIDMTVTPADTNYLDGSRSWQWGSWGLVDKNNNTLQSSIPEAIINGKYVKDVTITTPSNIDDYALVGIITQISSNWNPLTGEWVNSEEVLLSKEAINIKTRYSLTEPTTPIPGLFTKFFQSIWNWIKSIFGVN